MKKYREKYIFCILFIFLGVIFAFKNLISTEISLSDELHMIATSLRLVKGDSLFRDVWEATQLNAVLLYPFVDFFVNITGGTEGIVLFLRYVHLVLKSIICIYAFYRFSKYSDYGKYGYATILMFFIFSPYNMDTLTYNQIPLSMVYLISVIMLTERNINYDYFIIGICLAVAILSQPFLIFLYVALFFICIYKDKTGIVRFLWVTLGALSVALVFGAFVLSRCSVSEILGNISYVLSEPDHSVSNQNFIVKCARVIYHIFYEFFVKYYPITIINIIYFILCKFINKIRVIGVWILDSIILLFINPEHIENLICIVFLWTIIELYIEKAIISKQEKSILLINIVYMFGIAISTNTGLLSVSAAMCGLGVCSLICMKNYKKQEEKIKSNLNMVTIILVFCVLHVFITWTTSYEINKYNNKIIVGPLAGTFSSEEVVNENNRIIADLSMISHRKSDILFCGTSTPLAYVYLNINFGTMGTAFFHLDYDRYFEYLNRHPDKYPTIIYYSNISLEEKEKIEFRKLVDNYQIIIEDSSLLAILPEK